MKKAGIVVASVAVFVVLEGPALAADTAKGEADFKAKCAICHQIGPGAQNGVGPELNAIIGRKAASVAGFANYSATMKKMGADGYVWTEENIDKWIHDPKAMIPDSMMSLAFAGIPDATERADIIAYLKSAPQ